MDPSVPPVASPYPRPELQGSGPKCPKCGGTQTKKVGYTWWGGVLGPKLMNLHKCQACKFQFNAKTGKSVSTAIWIYNLVAIAIAIVIIIAIRG